MAVYKATGTINWFNVQESKAQFNSEVKDGTNREKNIFLNTDGSIDAVALPDSIEFAVCPMIKGTVESAAQNGSSIMIYIENHPIPEKCPKKNTPNYNADKVCDECPLKKDSEKSNPGWIIVNVIIGIKNEK